MNNVNEHVNEHDPRAVSFKVALLITQRKNLISSKILLPEQRQNYKNVIDALIGIVKERDKELIELRFLERNKQSTLKVFNPNLVLVMSKGIELKVVRNPEIIDAQKCKVRPSVTFASRIIVIIFRIIEKCIIRNVWRFESQHLRGNLSRADARIQI